MLDGRQHGVGAGRACRRARPGDSLEDHVRDTLAAGAGLCDEAVVRELVEEAPKSIRYLMRLGAAFDPGAEAASGAHPRGWTQPQPDRPCRWRPAAAPRCSARSTSRRSAPASRCSSRAFALDLVMGTRADRRTARRPGCGSPTLDAEGRVVSVGIVTARAVVIAYRRLRPDLRLHVEPTRRHRRRHGASRCAPDCRSATSSSCSSTRR